nr:BTAD domain-containing putative transcriptional regulator [Kibdelosporangium sp. MJ126-NF4]
MVTFSVLGAFEARNDDTVIELGGARHREVLARLLLSRGQVVAMDRLIEDIWGRHPPRHAVATVRTIVFHLRRALEPDRLPRTPARVLVTSAPGYALRAEPNATDAWRLELLADEAGDLLARQRWDEALTRCRQALRLWRGAPYAEFRDTTWASAEIERLTEIHLALREGQATALLGANRQGEALPDLITLTAEYPLREECWRLLALALYRNGRQADALDAIRRVRTLLRDELGVDPGQSLCQLEAGILAQSPELLLSSTLPTAFTTSAVPTAHGNVDYEPIVGRKTEVDRLMRLAGEAKAGHRRLALLQGPPGIGKTTLTGHVMERLRDEGWIVVATRCPEIAGAPEGWPWLEIVTQLQSHTVPPAELAERLDGRWSSAGTLDNAIADRFRFCCALGAYLAGVAEQAPLMVVLGDLHRADADTLTPLVELAGQLTEHRLLIVATLRRGTHSEVLDTALAGLARYLPTQIDLGGLDEHAVAALVRARHVRDVGPDLARQITLRTGGNPLLVHEVARTLADEGPRAALSQVPAGARAVLNQRLAALPEPIRVLLRKAAVLGEEFDLDVLAAMAGDHGEDLEPDYDAMVEATEAGLAVGVLDSGSEPGTLRFAHTLMHEAVHDSISAPRRALWHRRAAAILVRLQPSAVQALARHCLYAPTAQTAEAAIRAARAAADQATNQLAFAEAIRLRTAALSLVDRFGGTARERIARTGELIHAHALLNNNTEMYELRDHVLPLLSDLDDPALTLQVVVSTESGSPMLGEQRVSRGHDARQQPTIALLERHLRDLPDGDSELRALLLTALAFETYGERSDRGKQAAEQAHRIATRVEVSAETRARILIAEHTQAFAVPGGLAQRERVAADLLALATTHRMSMYAQIAQVWQVYAAEQHGDHADVTAAIDDLERHMTYYPHPDCAARLQWHRALLLDLTEAPDDDVTRAYRHAAVAMAVARRQDVDQLLLTVRWCRAYRAGRAAEMVPELARIHPAWPATAPVYGLTLALAGRLDEARDRMRTGFPPIPDAHYERDMAMLGLTAVRLGDREIADAAHQALLSADGQILGPPACVFLPVRAVLDELAAFLGGP